MKGALILALVVVSFAAGWFAHRPAPPSPPVTVVKEIAAQAETVFVRDTLVLTRWQTQYDTIRSIVVKNLTDTVGQPLRYIQVADSTIASCRQALASCTKALDAAKVVIRVQDSERPSKVKVWTERIALVGLTWAVSRAADW